MTDQLPTVIRVRPGFQTHIPRDILHAAGAKEGDYIEITIRRVISPSD